MGEFIGVYTVIGGLLGLSKGLLAVRNRGGDS
jgi:hypothetical protein